MKYAVFTFDGYGLAIANRLRAEGRDVVVGQVSDRALVCSELEQNMAEEPESEKERRLGPFDGVLPKVPAAELVEKVRKHADNWFVFSDLNHLFRVTEGLRETGCPGIYPTEEDYLLEIDRERAKDFVAENYPSVKVGQKKGFSKAAQAKRFLKGSEEMWVLKGLAEDARTVVPDVEDLDLAHGQVLDALGQHSEEYEGAGFILELLIPNAIELTPQKIYLDGNPVATCMCIENKPLGAGNVGPMTDCAQDLVFRTEMDDPINAIAFPPAVDEMAKQRQGLFYWDASLLINPRTGGVFFGEFCANRVGYNCLYTEIALCGSASGYFEALAQGKDPYPIGSVAGSCRLFNLNRDGAGAPMAGGTVDYKPRVEEGLWLKDVRKQGRRLVSAGYCDAIGVITGAGNSVGEAAKRLYKRVDEFSFEGAFYRPHFDFVSREYRSSMINRLNYGLQRSFYKIGFGLD
ncbi:MAG: hypothetical protein ACAH95_03945 [Fimbriimonas sp.]